MTFEEWDKDTSNSPDQYPNYMEAFFDVSPKGGHEALKSWLEEAYKAGYEHGWNRGAVTGDYL